MTYSILLKMRAFYMSLCIINAVPRLYTTSPIQKTKISSIKNHILNLTKNSGQLL